jgi:flagellar basal-body rod protein FlgF
MDGIDWAASAMGAARARLEIATGNLANVSSDGFARIVARGNLGANGVRIVAQQSREHGPLRHTGRDLDFAIVGDGDFRVRDASGRIIATRNGAFTRDRDGTLRDDAGRVLLGRHRPLRVPEGATIDERGRVMQDGREIDAMPLASGARLRTGFLEAPNVNAIDEMVDVLTAQRSFESAEKVVAAIDGDRQKASNDVARIK